MKILIVGSGGREHALAWRLKQSPRVTEIMAAPGNPGIARIATCVPVAADNIEGLVALAKQERPNLVIVGILLGDVGNVAGPADDRPHVGMGIPEDGIELLAELADGRGFDPHPALLEHHVALRVELAEDGTQLPLALHPALPPT